MKIKIKLLSFLLLLVSFNVFADNVFVRTPELTGKLTAPAVLNLTDWQTIMSCHFNFKGSRKESVRYPQTIIKSLGNNEYSLFIKKGSLSETLPGWKLLTCAYKLLLIGKNSDLNGRSVFGEIYLLGQEHGEMSTDELKDMQNKNYVAKILTDKTQDLKIAIAPEGGIVAE
ncbi:MAG: hypothetical protein H7281_12715 [Bacteriovorax sp.]|nr:hypothetical protein [Bacteriovorax sp.]